MSMTIYSIWQLGGTTSIASATTSTKITEHMLLRDEIGFTFSHSLSMEGKGETQRRRQ